jgi:hypothetical protein
MMSMFDASHLKLVLSGQRFRVDERHWVVNQTRVDGNQLLLELSGPSVASIECELPDSFDCHSGQHMGWLIGQIEAQLKGH